MIWISSRRVRCGSRVSRFELCIQYQVRGYVIMWGRGFRERKAKQAETNEGFVVGQVVVVVGRGVWIFILQLIPIRSVVVGMDVCCLFYSLFGLIGSSVDRRSVLVLPCWCDVSLSWCSPFGGWARFLCRCWVVYNILLLTCECYVYLSVGLVGIYVVGLFRLVDWLANRIMTTERHTRQPHDSLRLRLTRRRQITT
jgi:hypothetical protein